MLLLFGGRLDPKPHCQLRAAVTGMPGMPMRGALGILNQVWKELVHEVSYKLPAKHPTCCGCAS